jgi:DNA polymerase-1
MLVTKQNFEQCLADILEINPLEISADTETTTIHWWNSPWHPRKPRVFSLQLYFEHEEKEYGYYFDFGCEHSVIDDILDSTHWAILQWKLFSNPNILWDIANAKFDMHHLANHGVTITGAIWCTKAMARVVNNQEGSLKLDELCKKYLGEEKIDIISYLEENTHYIEVKSPFASNSQDPEKVLCFDKAPLSMLIEYGIRDTKLCYKLAKWQRAEIAKMQAEIFSEDDTFIDTPDGKKPRGIEFIAQNEMALTKVLFEMERHGVSIDLIFCSRAFDHEKETAYGELLELQKIASEAALPNTNFNSNDDVALVFDALKIPYGKTKTGRAQFTKYTLDDTDHEIAKRILKYRYHYKRAYTYFKNYLELADEKGFIHPDFQPAGANTGRFSCWNPNLQNIPKRNEKQEKDFPIRAAFKNLDDDHYLFSFDYNQMEYRLMINYANETEVARKINEDKLDPHQAIGDEVGMERDNAKNLNFAVLYGAGLAKIANMIGNITEFGAGQLRKRYFIRLPGVKRFIDKVRATAKQRGFIFSIFGRVLHFDSDTSWRASNHIIQGGCADIMKTAMVNLFPFLIGKKSKLVLQVHDELLFYIHKSELDLVPKIIEALEKTYTPKILPLTSGAAYSKKAWNALEDGLPLE